MPKIVKFVLLASFGVLACVAALMAYIAVTFDPNDYKPHLVKAFKDKTQRDLRIEGDLKLSLFPGIAATLNNATLSDRASAVEFARADRIRFALKLLPLLSHRVLVDGVEATNLHARLVRFKDGTMNIDDLIGARAKPASPPANLEMEFVIDIGRIGLENAVITYTDEAAAATYTVSNLNLTTGRIANRVPSHIDSSFDVQSAQRHINLKAVLKTALTFDLDRQSYLLEGLDLSVNGVAAGTDPLAATAKGNIDIRLETQEFLLSNLAINTRSKYEGGDLDLVLETPQLSVSRHEISSEKLTLGTTYNSAEAKISARFDIPHIRGNMQWLRASEMGGSIDVQQKGAAVKAKLKSRLAASIEAKQIELEKWVATVNLVNPRLVKIPITASIAGSASVDFAAQKANLAFTTKVDDSTLSGKTGLARFSPPLYTFDITIDQLDADRYLPQRDVKEQPFELSALQGLNASGTLKIGTLKLANVIATNVRFEVQPPADGVKAKPVAWAPPKALQARAFSARAAGAVLTESKALL